MVMLYIFVGLQVITWLCSHAGT